MKIKRIHTNFALMSLGHKHTFDNKDHELSFNNEFQMFQIDGTLVPVSSIREVLTEENPIPFVSIPNPVRSGQTESKETVTPKTRRRKTLTLEDVQGIINL
jgi:hypothetical protein